MTEEKEMEAESEKKNYKPSTSCLSCIFAEWDIDETKEFAKQTGCEFDRLDTFRSLGHEVEDQTTEIDGRKYEYYKINERICNRSVRVQAMAGIPEDRWKTTTEEFTKARIAFLIYADENNTPEDIFYSLDIILRENQEQPPKEVCVWLDTNKISRQTVSEYFKSKNLHLKWTVHSVYYDGEPLGYNDATDEMVKKIKTTFYCPIRAGEITPVNFVAEVDNIINEKLKDFLLLVDDTDKPLLFLTNLNRPLGGSFEIPLEEKIRAYCEDKGLEAKILNYYEA